MSWWWLCWGLGTAHAVEVVDRPLPDRSFDRVIVDLGGFIQPRFRDTPADEAANTPGEIGFSLQRVRLEQEASLLAAPGQRLGFSVREKISIELMPEARLQDAYVDVGLGTPLRFRVGQFKAPVHRAVLASDSNNLFPDRNQITRWFSDREIGAMVHGWVGERHLLWQAAMFNGEGTNRLSNVNRRFYYVARAVVSPFGSPGASYEILRDWRADPDKDLPVVSLGGSVFLNIVGPPGQEEGYSGYNVESFFHWRFVTAQAETFFKFTDYEQQALADANQLGWYVQAGAFLEGIPWARDHVALMGRAEQGDRQQPLNADVPVAGPTDPNQASRRFSVGAGLYAGRPMFDRVQDLRLVVSYTFKEELEGFPYDNDELNISANLNF